jgi:cytochrome c556
MLKTLIAIAIASGIAVSGFIGIGGAQEDKVQDNRPFMRAKVEHAKEIVGGLALEDFDAIAKYAQKLTLLSQESNWNVYQTEKYVKMSDDFRGATARLYEAAKEKDLEGATLAYFEVTLNCVRCHKEVRRKEQVK